jgi:hypothetical protein
MNALLAAGGQSVLILILIFWFFFVAASLAEGQGRAVRRSIGVLGLIAGINVLLYSLPERAGNWGFGLVLALTAAVLLFFLLSPRPRRALEIVGRPRRIDERDVIFARFDLRPGSPGFIEYYGRRPQYEEKDASIRKIPDVLSATTRKKAHCFFPWHPRNSIFWNIS